MKDEGLQRIFNGCKGSLLTHEHQRNRVSGSYLLLEITILG